MSRKEYDLEQVIIDEIHTARNKIKQEAEERTKAEELAILKRAHVAALDKPLYILIFKPNDEDLPRCVSMNFEEILKHLIEVEIFHYYDRSQQGNAKAKVKTLAELRPTEGKPIYFQLPQSDHGSYPYMIKCISADDFIKQIKSKLQSKDNYLASLSLCSCAGWDD